jgi:hypothetical protein
MDFDIAANDQQKYKLEVIAQSDGYKDYDEVWVKIVPGKIESIRPNPANDYVIVTCVFNDAANVVNAHIRISDQTGKIYNTFPLTMSPQSIDFSVSTYRPGTYTVTLICNGQVADAKTFVKQ